MYRHLEHWVIAELISKELEMSWDRVKLNWDWSIPAMKVWQQLGCFNVLNSQCFHECKAYPSSDQCVDLSTIPLKYAWICHHAKCSRSYHGESKKVNDTQMGRKGSGLMNVLSSRTFPSGLHDYPSNNLFFALPFFDCIEKSLCNSMLCT